MKTTVISVLGNRKDAAGGFSIKRWRFWRPNIGLVQQNDLPIDELHLIFGAEHRMLAERIRKDIFAVSPSTNVIFDIIELKDPWDFEEVYAKFYDYAKNPCFHEENTQYFIHMSTGSHVEQICLFLLTESRHLPGKLIQTAPPEGHIRGSSETQGTYNIIDLDLSRYDKLAKRFEFERQNDLSFLKQGIETKNPAFNKLIETIERVATRSAEPILLTGPTGAGKSQLAKRIFQLKKNNGQISGGFVDVNCATLGGELAKSALFGYKKGAFTGANTNHDGYLKEAESGILFLDEIGELPLEAQAMLLKAIEEKTFRPLGAARDEHSDFQLICGTNHDLVRDVHEGRFRADLLARINLWSFKLPGLAERREDIEPNLDYELERFAKKSGKHITFNREARERFLAFALDENNRWSGNFRDLNAMVVRMATLAEGGRITGELVEAEITRCNRSKTTPATDDWREAFVDREMLTQILGPDYATRFDSIELVQLAHVIAICRDSASAADAARKLFAISRKNKNSANDSDRLTKFLARFGLKFKAILNA